MKDTYGNIDIYVTESGAVDCGTTWDQARIDYLKRYTNSLLEGNHCTSIRHYVRQ